MKQVSSPASAVEAHLIAHVLEQAGIPVHVHGAALQGAVGGLPARDFIRLWVPDEDFDEARALLEAWEEAAPAPQD